MRRRILNLKLILSLGILLGVSFDTFCLWVFFGYSHSSSLDTLTAISFASGSNWPLQRVRFWNVSESARRPSKFHWNGSANWNDAFAICSAHIEWSPLRLLSVEINNLQLIIYDDHRFCQFIEIVANWNLRWALWSPRTMRFWSENAVFDGFW